MTRRWSWLFVTIGLCLLGGCRKHEPEGPVLRLGYFPNATHAQALVGVHEGTFARALSPARLETRVFNAGPAAMEALLSGALDASYVGTGPALNAYLRSNGELRIIAAAVDGGAGLYLKPGKTLDALKGLRLAVPQLGNSQDIALRHYLIERGLDPARDVRVVTVPNPEIITLFQRGELDGAFVPEPWGSHLELLGAKLAVDERELWPGQRFHTTVLVASRRALAEKRPQLEALVRAHQALTRQWAGAPDDFARRVSAAFGAQVGAAIEPGVLARAFTHLTPAVRPDPRILSLAAARGKRVGYLQDADVSASVDDSLLGPGSVTEDPGASSPRPGTGTGSPAG